MNQNGMLPLIYAHLFSLSQMREVFGRQMQQGKAPEQVPRAGVRERSESFGRGRELPAEQSFSQLDRERLDQIAARSKSGPGASASSR